VPGCRPRYGSGPGTRFLRRARSDHGCAASVTVAVADVLVGMAIGGGLLVVPAANVLTAFGN